MNIMLHGSVRIDRHDVLKLSPDQNRQIFAWIGSKVDFQFHIASLFGVRVL